MYNTYVLLTLNDGGVEGYLHTEYLANLCTTFYLFGNDDDETIFIGTSSIYFA